MSNSKEKLLSQYKWLNIRHGVEEYVAPNYYNKLLKKYVFDGKNDTDFFIEFIKNKSVGNALELGSGSGRVTSKFNKIFPATPLTLVDLSEQMMDYTKEKFKLRQKTAYSVMDAVKFMEKTSAKYDFTYSLWSFSHATHQHMHRLGYGKAYKYISKSIKKFVRNNLTSQGGFFLMHFDSLSPEQRILMRQWKRVYDTFSDISRQSPSKRMLDDIFTDLDDLGEIQLSIKHLQGNPIRYKSLNELLEIFMNFHLETYFNDHRLASIVINDIINQAEPYLQSDGSYLISPGCYIYSFTKS